MAMPDRPQFMIDTDDVRAAKALLSSGVAVLMPIV
jgi:hypothetical protein